MFLIDILITCFIKYELDEFELNWMNVYARYDVVSMFVNDMEWWLRHSIFRKGDTHVEIVRMCIVWGFDLRRYPDSTGTLESYRWRITRWWFIWPCPRFEIWADQTKTCGLIMCIWKLYLRFEIGTYQNRLYLRFEIGNDQNRWKGIWQVLTSKSNSMDESSRSREFSILIYESVYLWYELL